MPSPRRTLRAATLAPIAAGCIVWLSLATLAAAAHRTTSGDSPTQQQSHAVRFDFAGGTAKQYFEQVEQTLREQAASIDPSGESGLGAPSLILMPGLDLVPIPTMTLRAVVRDPQDFLLWSDALLAAFGDGPRLSDQGSSYAQLETRPVPVPGAGPLVLVSPRFLQATEESGRMELISPARWSTISDESADVDARGVTSVSFFALGDAAPDTVLDAVAAAIELAGLGDETELLLHPASGTLIARTTAAGDDLIGRAIYSILHEQPALQLQGGAVPKAEYERLVDETRALGDQLRSRSTEIQRLNSAMERLKIDLFDRERRIATLLAQLEAHGIAPQAAPQPEP